MVQVLEKPLEHLINLKNVGFTRKMLEVTAGDLVWVHWRPSKVSTIKSTLSSLYTLLFNLTL